MAQENLQHTTVKGTLWSACTDMLKTNAHSSKQAMGIYRFVSICGSWRLEVNYEQWLAKQIWERSVVKPDNPKHRSELCYLQYSFRWDIMKLLLYEICSKLEQPWSQDSSKICNCKFYTRRFLNVCILSMRRNVNVNWIVCRHSFTVFCSYKWALCSSCNLTIHCGYLWAFMII